MALARLKTYFVDAVLPHWLAVAFDPQAGQFVEGLDLDGTPEKTGIVRTRTAARQIYVYAHASVLGVAPPGSLDKAETAFANLRRMAWIDGAGPGYASAFNFRSGDITDPKRELYDHACVLLALAWLSKATGNRDYLRLIDEATRAVDITLAAGHGGWAEDETGTLPRRQNPHMHYFEACLALWETGHDSRHVARAGELFSLFRTRFYDDEIATLREYFGPAWEISDVFGSGRLDPGHMSEWVWLISRYDRLAGTDHSAIIDNLLKTAHGRGRSRTAPFLVDEMDVDGTPLVSRRRLWPQAELLKAYFMRATLEGGGSYRQAAEDLADALLKTYLAETPAATWRDCFDIEGGFTATSIPGSSLYHLWSGVAELISS